ncbi:disease resistance protein RGA5-like [Miscanthus floridulus]|uniref:disease resistance protein RGA5-like n=1 Tax=Miscanthus floridulus TaxID=154761 RepID=UPI00345AFB6F
MAMVSASHGAMDSLLRKLGDLLTDKYKLLKEAKREIRSLRSELNNMYAFLKDMSGMPNPNEQAKCWMNEVRELSYDIDDSVDEFMIRVEQESSSKPQGFRGFIDRCLSLLTTIKAHHQITRKFRGLKRLAEEVSERRKRYRIDDTISKQQDTTIDPRMLALYTETARLVGIDGPRDELIQLMMGEDDQLKVISIVGFGGLGKTTLASEIFHKLEGQYQCQSFVPVSQKPNLLNVLRKVLFQVGYAAPENTNMEIWDVDELISTLHKFLTGKRFFIVIDDIWDATAWSTIRCALPENKNGSRVIATTRIEAVAAACCSNDYEYVYKMKALDTVDSRRLFFKRIFGSEDTCPPYLEEVSTGILKRCGGMPLAIITLSSHLATRRNKLDRELWEHTLNSLGCSLELNPTLEGMRQILSLSYTNLPHCLKACVLYLGMYPEDHEISKTDLVRQWVAQGFISKAGGQDAEDIAVDYFNEIVNRSIIQPAHTDSNNDVLSCRVHDMMLDLIIHKCREENFVTASDDIQDISGTRSTVRRLSLYLNGVTDSKSLGTIQLSHVRALTRFGTSTYIPPLGEFKHLRVLNLELRVGVAQMTVDLTGLCYLFQLRYLKIMIFGFGYIELPSKISGLQQLETLEIDVGKVQIPSDVVHLRRLRHLIVSGGFSLPGGIGNMKSIHTLRFRQLCMSLSSADTIKEIGELTNLRDLQLRFNYERRSTGYEAAARQSLDALHSSLGKLLDLRYLDIKHDGCLDDGFSSLSGSGMTLWGWHSRLPRWIGQLQNLHDLQLAVKEVHGDDIRILAQLASLTNLHVKIQATPRENMVICRAGFPVLKHFEIGCSRMSYLIFEAGAMPRLQMLEVYFNASGWDKHGGAPTGIEHLSGLKEITVRISGRGARESNRRAALSALRNAADAHPGYPTTDIRCFDDMWTDFDDYVMEEAQEPVDLSP